MSSDKLDELAIENFREYLRIPSVQPNVNYDDCVIFIKKQAKSLDLPVKVFEIFPGKPIVVITWEGFEPEKPSILLNGHMDVVPVYLDQWKYPPFAAHMDEKGDIYGRGSQDMKSVSIQYIESIRRLKLNGIRLKRTIHISFVPDEEIGGKDGMEAFVATQDFKNLDIGFALDEGIPYPTESFILFYGERSKWDVWIHCSGQPGHGSLMSENNSGEKFYKVIDRFMKFRDAEKKKLQDPKIKPGDVTSVNLTMVKELSVGFDIRIAPDVDHKKFENMIKSWCEEAGQDVSYQILTKNRPVENTKLDENNIFWVAFKNACDDANLELEPIICPGGTDARYVRKVGIPALGFTPANNTSLLLHDNNERLNKDVFLRGIDIYMKIIPAVANA
ncbi:aminoacylase-1-like isoform X2 [Belonocnema kinseyi]|uniref:aminoacylase-1-like isoform X2 n=1 Tax=Belonocnema kinseyi TaxID=2817044 RepID=UPI00143D2AD8|nr:aminoacylase-1-like isoform X2 [Belonocnema kinseyi]